MFESGSSACIWDDDSVKTLRRQLPAGRQRPRHLHLLRRCAVPAGGQAGVVLCTLKKLSEEFTDENDKPVPIVVDGREVRFEDISFLPNRLSWWRTSVYGLDRTDPSIPGDADNTLGMAMQFLLLKHSTEARWVRVPGWESLKDELDFEDALRKMRDATFDWVRSGGPLRLEAMSPVEAYETANLMEFNLYKSKMYVRVKGASDERSAFNGLLIQQLHNAAKAGIRATLAKMIAAPQGPRAAARVHPPRGAAGRVQSLQAVARLRVQRVPDDRPGPRRHPLGRRELRVAGGVHRLGRRAHAALVGSRGAATRAVHRPRDQVRHPSVLPDQGRPRADRLRREGRRVPRDDPQLGQRMVAETEAIYNEATLASTRGGSQREDNMSYKRTRILVRSRSAPRWTSRPASSTGVSPTPPDVKVGCTPPTRGLVTARQTQEVVFLSGGTEQQLEFKRLPNGELELDDKGKKIGIFYVKDIDQTQDAGEARRVAFSIDLPERSVKEAYRENNIGGFFWYVLDTQTAQPPTTAAKVPPPCVRGRCSPRTPTASADPRLAIDQFITYNGEVQPNPAFIIIDEPATYTTGGVQVLGSRRRDGLRDPHGQVPPSVWLLPRTVQLPVPTDKAFIYDVVPTAYSSTTGIQRGSSLRVVVSCERYTLTAVAPDQPRERSRIMQGGRSYRYFRVIDQLLKGPPSGPVTVTLTLSGPASFSYTFTTNTAGDVGRQVGTAEEPAFEPGVSFVYDEGHARRRLRRHRRGGAGEPALLRGDVELPVELLPFTYTEAMKAGASLSVGVGNPFKKRAFRRRRVHGLAGRRLVAVARRQPAGRRAHRQGVRDRPLHQGRNHRQGQVRGRPHQAEGVGGPSPPPTKIRNRGKVRPIKSSAEGAGVEAEASFELLHGDAHRFTLPLDSTGSKALAAFVLEAALETVPGPAGMVHEEVRGGAAQEAHRHRPAEGVGELHGAPEVRRHRPAHRRGGALLQAQRADEGAHDAGAGEVEGAHGIGEARLGTRVGTPVRRRGQPHSRHRRDSAPRARCRGRSRSRPRSRAPRTTSMPARATPTRRP